MIGPSQPPRFARQLELVWKPFSSLGMGLVGAGVNSFGCFGWRVAVYLCSGIVEVLSTKMLKLLIWYENEWGYSMRCADLVLLMAKSL